VKTPKRIRHVEAEGFYHGTQGVGREPMLVQIAAQFEATRAEVREKFARILKRLEARMEVLRERKGRAEARLAEVVAETGGRRPEILAPLFWLALGLCAVVGEVILIAPVLDGWGIADPEMQLFAAAVIVLTASGLFERVLRRVKDGSHPEPARVSGSAGVRHLVTVLLAVFALALLAAFGWWRANEMIFASSVSGGEWGSFLARNPDLTRTSVILLTLGLPLFAALTMDWGFRELRLGFAWHRAERTVAHCAETLRKLPKRHEEKTLALGEKLKGLQEEERKTAHAYLEHHELGVILGAVKEHPAWIVLRAMGLVLLLVAACLLLDPLLARHVESSRARVIFYILATAGTIALYLAHALGHRERPTSRDLYRNRAVRWRDATAAELATRIVPPAADRAAMDGDVRHDGWPAPRKAARK
jgi:hypothetical protein